MESSTSPVLPHIQAFYTLPIPEAPYSLSNYPQRSRSTSPPRQLPYHPFKPLGLEQAIAPNGPTDIEMSGEQPVRIIPSLPTSSEDRISATIASVVQTVERRQRPKGLIRRNKVQDFKKYIEWAVPESLKSRILQRHVSAPKILPTFPQPPPPPHVSFPINHPLCPYRSQSSPCFFSSNLKY